MNIKKNTEAFFAGVVAQPEPTLFLPGPVNAPNRGDAKRVQQTSQAPVDSKLLQMLHPFAAPIPIGRITEVYEQLGISRTQGANRMKQLVAAGLLVTESLPTGQRGGSLKIGLITEHGWNLLRERGIVRPKPQTHGGPLHNVIAEAVVRVAKRSGFRSKTEVTVGDVRFDVVLTKSETPTRFIQIGVSSESREADSIHRVASQIDPPCGKFVLVGRNAKFLDGVRKIIKRKAIDLPIHLVLAGKVLNAYYERKDINYAG